MSKRNHTVIKSYVSEEFKKKVQQHAKDNKMNEAHFLRQCVQSVIIGAKKPE